MTTIAIDDRPRPRRYDAARRGTSVARSRLLWWAILTAGASAAVQLGLGQTLHGWFF